MENNQRIKMYTLLGSLDLIAKAPILNMNQHNGYFGCSSCLIEGEHINNVHVYPYVASKKATARTYTGYFNDAKKAIESGKKVLDSFQNSKPYQYG